jgi:uncharacterized membrane protein
MLHGWDNKYQNKFAIFLLLAAASMICFMLAFVRMTRSDSTRYGFLLWNLMLAWIPFVFAALAYALANVRKRILYLLILAAAGAWLVFFPNAPYILTDFQHLSQVTDGIPVWYDVLLLIWFAWTGLLLGMASLYLMQEIVARMLGSTASWLFVVCVTGLSSFGIYVGRFMHWNSWDAWTNPLPLAQDIWDEIRHPLINKEAYGFTFMFTLLFLFIYVALGIFGNLTIERQKQKLAGAKSTQTKQADNSNAVSTNLKTPYARENRK